MNLPDTPSEFFQLCMHAKLDELPEGSIVQVPASQLLRMVDAYTDLLHIVSKQQELLDGFIEKS